MSSTRTKLAARLAAAMMLLGVACGGGQKGTVPEGGGVGQTHVPGAGDVPMAGEEPAIGYMDAGLPEMDAGPPPAAVTFRIVNTAEEELVFSVEKGWQPIIAAWTGQPPKAKPIIMFPKFCTASCDLPEDAICPYCPEPETNKERAALEQHVTVPPGEALEVPWDGMAHVYEKARGTQIQQEGGRAKKARCECWRQVEPGAEEYTLQVCGLRVTKEAGKRSQYQCIRTAMTLPPAETPTVIDVEFPAPEDPTKARGKKKRR